MKQVILMLSIMVLGTACRRSSYEETTPAPKAVRAADPSGECQRALSHLLDLSIRAIGEGPSDGDRGEFMRRCMEAKSEIGAVCVQRIKSLGKSNRTLDLKPVWRCLHRR